ncbi:MAG: hypothetical protein PHS33_08575 [Candidatus Omnitrophica bacterium]|nr:hypothetical protein [Candidatus Omnitrophota bacterium]
MVDVKFVDDEDINKDCGEANFKTNTIKISNRLNGNNLELTLLHEMIHHIDPAMSESRVELYSRALYQALKDNNFI